MKKIVAGMLAILIVLVGCLSVSPVSVQAANKKEIVNGAVYELGEKDDYEISKAQKVDDVASRFYVMGDISAISTKNGFPSYAVDSDCLRILVSETYGKNLFSPKSENDWHIVTDKSKTVDSTKLSEKIGSGAIVVQTSKDGKTWITDTYETDIYNKMDAINSLERNGEKQDSFYETTSVQLSNGCYYRIIVAYKLQRKLDPSKFLFIDTTDTEEKEQIEIYEFYAFNPSVNQAEELDTSNAYEFGDVYRVDSQDGFEDPKLIDSNDPHNDWSVGKFYVSGYTDYRMDGDVPVFLKVPGDKAALWFNLEQEIDKCNGRPDVKINYISSGSDIYFGTPTIDNFGRGALIVRKTDYLNKKERQIYTNYLEASATVGANTRVDLFEEGDYEVALDYQLHYDKPFVFGTTTTKTLTYRVFFKFKVRNGDVSAFLRDVDTDQFITNANVAEHGFYIDVANSQYLNMSIKREVLTESMDGLVEDTKFTGVAKEGRKYTDEGIYTVTIQNPATGDTVEKKVYVGDEDIMRAHMATGLSISEINERLAAGAYIDEKGQIVDAETEEVIEEAETEEPEVVMQEDSVESTTTEETEENLSFADESKSEDEGKNLSDTVDANAPNIMPAIVIIAIILVVAIALISRKNKKKKGDKGE